MQSSTKERCEISIIKTKFIWLHLKVEYACMLSVCMWSKKYVCRCMYMCMCVCIWTYVYENIHVTWIHVRMCAYVYVCVCMCMCLFLSLFVCLLACLFVGLLVCMYVRTCVRTYVYNLLKLMFMHTRITKMYTQDHPSVRRAFPQNGQANWDNCSSWVTSAPK